MSEFDQLLLALLAFAGLGVLLGTWQEHGFRKSREEQEAREAAARHAAE